MTIHEQHGMTTNNVKSEKLSSSEMGLMEEETTIFERGKMEMELEEEEDEDSSCGLGFWKPTYLQKMANHRSFVVVFSVMGIVQTMTWTYFVATITSMEKRFKLQSRTTGVVMMGNEISQIGLSLFLAYYGGRGHRPRWIAVGVLCGGLSCFLMALPHLIYGPGDDALLLTKEYDTTDDGNFTNIATSETQPEEQLCSLRPLNYSIDPLLRDECGSGGDLSLLPLFIIFLAQFVAGIGTTLYFSLGGPYMDDNVKKTQMPMMLGVMMCFRMLGPALGALLAFACLKMYVKLSLTPLIGNKDPRWLGAWWLGWVVLGVAMVLFSFFMALFPRHLPGGPQHRKNSEEKKKLAPLRNAGSELLLPSEDVDVPTTTSKDFPKAIARLLKNSVLLCDIMSSVFYIFGAVGYWSYKPKYLETVFKVSAAMASIITGTVSIIPTAIGLLMSGFLISKFRPRARLLCGWNVVIGILYIIVYVLFTGIGCRDVDMHGYIDKEGLLELDYPCNSNCSCAHMKFTPVCLQEADITFYSPCHAGCYLVDETNSPKVYNNCVCAHLSDTNWTSPAPQSSPPSFPLDGRVSSPSLSMVEGQCGLDCVTPFAVYLGLYVIIKLVDSTGRIGNVLVMYRCVEPRDKSLAVGFSLLLVSLLSLIPAPICVGVLIDQACLVWGEKCGERGNCWLYDSKKLQLYLNLFAAGFNVLAVIFDSLEWYLVKDLDLYGESDSDNSEKEKPLKVVEK